MHGNHSACELLPPFPTGFYGLLISCYLSPTLPVLSLSSIHNLARKLRIYFLFLPHCFAQQLQRCFRLIFQHPYRHCPQARDKSSSWTHHLDVLTLCGMIYRKAASIMISLTLCIDEMLKIKNCQDGTVHSLQLKQLSADSPKHTHTKKLQHQKQRLNPSVPMTGRPGAVSLSQKSGPTTSLLSPTNTGNSLLFLLAASLQAATDRDQAISGVAASRQESGD